MKSLSKESIRIISFVFTIIALIVFCIPVITNGSEQIFLVQVMFNLLAYSQQVALPGYSLIAWIIALTTLCSLVLLFLSLKFEKVNSVNFLLLVVSAIGLIILPDSINDTGIFSAGFSIWSYFAIVLVLIAALFSFVQTYSEHEYTVYEMVETALLISLAVGLDLDGLKITLSANGGSISFTCVPLILLALRHGFVKGFIGAGIIYGLITCLIDGYGLITYPLDYLLGFGSMAIVGLFRNKIIGENTSYNWKGIVFLCVGIIVATLGRFLAGSLSGTILYQVDFVESMIYNASYILPSGAAAIVIFVIFYKQILVIDKLFKNRLSKTVCVD